MDGGIPGLAFPDGEDAPSEGRELPVSSLVALDVPLELDAPELGVASRSRGEPASRMAVPEASVNVDHGSVSWQDDVRSAGQLADVKSVAKPRTV